MASKKKPCVPGTPGCPPSKVKSKGKKKGKK